MLERLFHYSHAFHWCLYTWLVFAVYLMVRGIPVRVERWLTFANVAVPGFLAAFAVYLTLTVDTFGHAHRGRDYAIGSGLVALFTAITMTAFAEWRRAWKRRTCARCGFVRGALADECPRCARVRRYVNVFLMELARAPDRSKRVVRQSEPLPAIELKAGEPIGWPGFEAFRDCLRDRAELDSPEGSAVVRSGSFQVYVSAGPRPDVPERHFNVHLAFIDDPTALAVEVWLEARPVEAEWWRT